MSVEDLIEKSLQELQKIGVENEISDKKQESKLIFPKYCVGKHEQEKRVSEQEARFLFVRELEDTNNKHCFYYSVETPTKLSYKFSDKNIKNYEPQIVSVEEGGQSASVDVTLYEKGTNEFERKHLIEFKQGNVKTCKKDFLKLLYDMDNLCNYYINIVDRDDLSKRNTLESIVNKFQKAIDELKEENINRIDNKSILKIILFNIKDGDKKFFKDINLKTDDTKIIEK